MVKANISQILVVAGDFDLIYHTQQALQSERFSIQRAFTHRDALYTLDHGQFDAVLVDAAMVDRYSGEITIRVLARQKGRIPLLAFALDDTVVGPASKMADAVITRLDKQMIQHTVLDALRIPRVTNGLAAPVTDDVLSRRIDEIQTLFALSKSLTEVLDLTEVLNRVVEAARRLTNAEEGMILLPDDEAGQLYLRAKVGIDVEVARNFRIKTQDTLAGQVFSSGQPILVGMQGPQKVKTEYFVNSLLYVPILLKGNPIGVLGVNNKNKEDVFDENHQELLLNLASFAAIAIENARIHEESLQRARELESLVEASQVVNSTLSLSETLPNICDQLTRVLNVNRSEIYQWDRDTRRLHSLARFHRSMWRFGQGPTIELAKHAALQTSLLNNRVFWATRSDKSLPTEAEYLQQVGAGAMLVVPVFLGEQGLGAVHALYIEPPEKLPPQDVAQRVGNIALEVLANVLNTATSRSQGAFRLMESINALLGADWSRLSGFANDRTTLVAHVEVGTGVWLKPPYATLDVSRYPDWFEALQSQVPIHQQIDSKKLTSAGRVLLETTNSRAVLGLPLVHRGQTQGLVVFADTERNRVFTKREIDLGRALVGQAATALENAKLVRDLEQSLQELKDTQARLVQTARLSAMGELAAVVAHQINNPLTTIVADTELMLMDEAPTSRNYATMQAISRAGRRAATVAKRLLAVARPNDPNTPPEPVDVVDTIKGVLSLVQTHIERERIRVLPKLPEITVPSVMAVRGQLEDVWLNLLTNARDALAGRPDATIGIDLNYTPGDKQIRVVVWDNGPGIPDHIKAQVFNPFFTTKPPGEGTGLGLHICRQVVERVGGTITLESQPGQGTRFDVVLPVKPSESFYNPT